MPEVSRLWQAEGLFSEHYLKARLNKNDWWPTDAETLPVWEYCRDLYNRRFLAAADNNEAFTRQELIDKIIARLGFAWTDNLSLPEQDAEPDYILFANEAEKEAVLAKDTATRYRAAAGILEAKRLQHPLGQVGKQQRYPHQQIRDYLIDARVLTWGILTNGNEWRLYSRDARRQDYFAINFEQAIQNVENFKFFLALFSPAAFQRDVQGQCRLDHVQEQSVSAQGELEADLRQRIFTILANLANGFASRPENQITDSREDLNGLYENCLIYLYRLLFLLYAEGRALLPVEPRSRRYYKELSLERLKGDLRAFTDFDSKTRTRLNEDIRELFRLVNGGDEAKNKEYLVARYNGGLFDPANFPLLEKWNISDADLAEVLRGLMFDPPPQPNEPALPVQTVDFGDLRVQQLGSIYEGLLEHHLTRGAAGALELKTDNIERKATGTYYTPDYVVRYIVEQAVEPVLEKIERSPAVTAAVAASQKDNSFAQAILRLNICDPAMGSGHFLVDVTTLMADQIVAHPTTRRLSEKSTDQDEVAYWRRRVVEASVYGVDLNPLAVELAKLSLWLTCIAVDQPLNFLDHHLRCGNSLVGARLDALGQLPQKKKRKGGHDQLTMTFGPDLKRAVADTIHVIRAIEDEASGDVVKVKTKHRRWAAEILPRLAPYKQVADLWTNTHFEPGLDEDAYLARARELLAPAAEVRRKRVGTKQVSVPAAPLPPYQGHPRRFFHWELEFPDVFFAEDGSPLPDPGFDVIVGNPPYIDIKRLEGDIAEYIFRVFSTAQMRINIFAAFLEQEFGIIKHAGGQLGTIIPSAFLTQVSYATLRQLFLKDNWVRSVVRLPNELFGSAPGQVKVDTCVVVVGRGNPPANAETQCLIYQGFGRIGRIAAETAPKAFMAAQSKWLARDNAEITLDEGASDIIQRISQGCQPLEEVVEFCLGLTPYDKYRGHTPEQIEGRVFHSTFKVDESSRPLLSSGDVKRYDVTWDGAEWIRYGDWLAAARERRFFTEERILFQQIIDWSSLRLQVGWTKEEYYNTQNQFNLLARPGTNLKFVLAVVASKLITFYHRRAFLDVALQRFQKVLIKDAKTFPIPRIKATTSDVERSGLQAGARKLFDAARVKRDDRPLLAFVAEQLSAKPPRRDVVSDVLAMLADRMLELNVQRRQAAQKFITDLKDFHSIEAHSLNPKTKLDQFWLLETPQLFAHLSKNRKILAGKVTLDQLAEEKIRSRFENAKKLILPIQTELQFVDNLVDQIVYRLYGLSDVDRQVIEDYFNRPPKMKK